MKIIKAGYEILHLDPDDSLHIERAARTCYKSEGNVAPGSAERMIRKLIENGHEAMLEHSQMTVIFTVDRGVSHELVRHRLASFAQESTRYCNYSKDKFGNEITVIEPCFYKDIPEEVKKAARDFHETDPDLGSDTWLSAGRNALNYYFWYSTCKMAESSYFSMLKYGATPQEARSILPNSLKTEVVVTANYREWRQIFKLRCAKDAHPQIREVMCPLLKEVKTLVPAVFDDIS